jgi:hypothetical protein
MERDTRVMREREREAGAREVGAREAVMASIRKR